MVGPDRAERERDHVHTIELWFSQKRKVWIVERLNDEGHHIGATYQTTDVHAAQACLEEWLRMHGETHLVEREAKPKRRRAVAAPKRRAA
jgi:hypothetical protein